MTAKLLLTGRSGAAIRDRVLLRPNSDVNGIWLAPSDLAARQMRDALGARLGNTSGLFIKPWSELWPVIAAARHDGPMCLSVAGARAVLAEVIRNRTRQGEPVVGRLRELRPQFDFFTRREFRREVIENVDPTVAAIYGEYQSLLEDRNLVDREGLAVWASKAFEFDPDSFPEWLGKPRFVNALDFDRVHLTPAIRRTLAVFESHADVVRVSTDGLELDGWFDRGYEHVAIVEEAWRPKALAAVEKELFRDEPAVIDSLDGLRIVGGPRGEGEALAVASEVKRLLDVEDVPPDEILIVARDWDDQTDTLLKTLQSWSIPVSCLKPGRPLATLSGVAALLLASEVAREHGWEVLKITRLLRHGMVKAAPTFRGWDRLAKAAALVRDTMVYQGRDRVRAALSRIVSAGSETPEQRRRAGEALEVVSRLFQLLEVWGASRTFRGHAGALSAFAKALGIVGIQPLTDVLHDQAAALDLLDLSERTWTFSEFADELHEIANDLLMPDDEAVPGTVVIGTADRAEGARASFVIHTHLSEGVYPSRSAVESLDNPLNDSSVYQYEQQSFLRIFGAADEGVILSLLNNNEAGQEILPSGFVEELLRLIDPKLKPSLIRMIDRVDPAFLSHPELAVAAHDVRVLAIARGAIRRDPNGLRGLAASQRHRDPLAATARALLLSHERRHGRFFGRFDGRMASTAIADVLAKRFSASATISASQLESYLHCRFQFFMNYVLGIREANDDDELVDDPLRRGTELHKFLEMIERMNIHDDRDRIELVDVVIGSEMLVELDGESTSESAPALRSIELARARRQLRGYSQQAAKYETAEKGAPRWFEVQFGGKNAKHPPLLLGEGDDVVRLQGKIDRIDQFETEQGSGIRIIDYKSGQGPSARDVQSLAKLQLPLYALAVERLGIAGPGMAHDLIDLAYWELRKKGFRRLKLDDWPSYRESLVNAVIVAVRSLREGNFEVSSTDQKCGHFCEYSVACRVKQVREAGKSLREDQP